MDTTTLWRDFFVNWPKLLARQGVLVTNFDEQIPFVGFMTSEAMLVLERRAPDTVGARKVIVPFASVTALKLVDVIAAKTFAAAGFVGELPNQ